MNPLLLRHLYSSARRNRFFVFLSIYLFVIAILTALFVLLTISSALFEETATMSLLDLFVQGRALYWFSGVILMLTAILLVPVNALGAVAGERENRTLDLLVTTTLRPRSIILGKVGASLLTGSLYILAPFPLLMIGFWLGGVTTPELLLTLLFLVLTMTLNVVWAVYLSTWVRKTIAAVILFYVVNLGILPVIALVIGLWSSLYDIWVYSEAALLPFWLEVVIQYGWVILLGLHPLAAAIATEALGLNLGSWWLLSFTVERFDPTKGAVTMLGTVSLPSPWIVFTVSTVLVSLFLLWRATKRVARPER